MSCVVFHVFFVPFTDFGKNHLVSSKIRPEIVTPIFGKKTSIYWWNRPIYRWNDWISVFLISTVPPSSLVRFGQIFPNFANFFWIFQKPTESLRSGFPSPAEFLNTSLDQFKFLVCGASTWPWKLALETHMLPKQTQKKQAHPEGLSFFVTGIFDVVNQEYFCCCCCYTPPLIFDDWHELLLSK
jgi:hypothetical protein